MRDFQRLLPYLGVYRRDLFIGALLVLTETCFELFIPVLMADIIDVGVAQRDLPFILHRGIQMALCALLSLAAGLLYAKFAARAAYGFGAEVRAAEYRKIQTMAFSNLDRFETSSLVTRLTTDITVLQNAFTGGLRPLVRSPIMLLLGIGLSFWMNAKLAVVFFVTAPVLAVILFFVVRRVAPMYGKLQRAMDQLNEIVEEGLSAIRAVKAFVREDYQEEKFEQVNTRLKNTSQRTFHFAVLNLPAFQFTMYSATIFIMWFGGGMILDGNLKVGDLTGFLSYVLQVMNSLMMISNVFLLLTRSLASAERIMEVLDEEPALASPTQPSASVSDGSIEFRNVSFKYREDSAEYALSDVSLYIPAGQTVGVIGGTGSSKTTLVQLVPRLYDAAEGQVLVGGKDVRAYRLKTLRDAVGIVLQKNVLFSGTIRENLLWGNEDAKEQELWEACRSACADKFLEKMPEGLDTCLQQGGVNLSGGQKQRLCIARALLKRPKILILDDSTSAVDTATEKKIQEALAEKKDVTKIIIAQRITSVVHADQIVILEDGRIHAVGTHRRLLAEDPIYKEIYASQMKGGSADGATVEQ